MGIGLGDYDRNGTIDMVKTNFAGDTSTLYANLGNGFCEDRTFASGLGTNTRWLGWGAGLVDLDNDAWLDIFLTNGHVYPEVSQIKTEAAYRQRKVIYRNLANGRFADVAERMGPPASTAKAGRGTAFGDIDNDGDLDIVVNNVHDSPDLFRNDTKNTYGWLIVKLTVPPRTAAPSAPAFARWWATSRWFRKFAAAAATSRRTTCACTSGWEMRSRWTGWKYGGQTGERRYGRRWRRTRSSPWRRVNGGDGDSGDGGNGDGGGRRERTHRRNGATEANGESRIFKGLRGSSAGAKPDFSASRTEEASDAVHQPRHVEVDQQTHLTATQLQIGQHLGLVHALQCDG